MKRILLAVALALPLGCQPANSPTPPVAPGYSSVTDQQVGESLAAINAFVNQEKTNYATLPDAQQAKEKPALNALITATNVANASYVAFHQGTKTMAQAQADLASAQQAQSGLAAVKGVQ